MEKIKQILILLCLLLLLTSCIRSYKVTFNYNVNGKVIKQEEVTITEDDERIVNLPQGSGNFIIYIQAEVPKNIDANADADVSLPLLP